jgi:hypothetical protein
LLDTIQENAIIWGKLINQISRTGAQQKKPIILLINGKKNHFNPKN